jgi:hypothetical protein
MSQCLKINTVKLHLPLRLSSKTSACIK